MAPPTIRETISRFSEQARELALQVWGNVQTHIPPQIKDPFVAIKNKIVEFIKTNQSIWFKPIVFATVSLLLSAYIILPILTAVVHYFLIVTIAAAIFLFLNYVLFPSNPAISRS